MPRSASFWSSTTVLACILLLFACEGPAGSDGATSASGAGGSTGNGTGGVATEGGGTTEGEGGETGTDPGTEIGTDPGTEAGGEVIEEPDPEPLPEPAGLPVLGDGTHDLNEVQWEIVAGQAEGLLVPRDLEFDPSWPGRLFIANTGSDSMTVLFDAGTATQTSQLYWSPGSTHFFAKPGAIAFGLKDELASIHDTQDVTQYYPDGTPATPADFMGPTLHWTDLAIYDAGHGSHLDMLHNSPLGTGIAWAGERRFWVFDGYHQSLTMYDFKTDHGPGGSDHSDALVERYVEGQISHVPGSVSHLAWDFTSDQLFVADTGHQRIALFSATGASTGAEIWDNYDGCPMNSMSGGILETFIDGAAVDPPLLTPAGLELAHDLLWVTDSSTATVYAFTLEGVLVDWLSLGWEEGALQGLEVDDDGNLWLTDAISNRIVLLRAPATEG